MDKVPKMEEYFDLSLYGSTETGEADNFLL